MSSVRTSVLNFTFGLLLNHIRDVTSNINVLCCVGRVGLSDEGPILETLDYTIRIGSTPTFLYFDLLLLTDYKKERWRIRNVESWLSGTSMILKHNFMVWLAKIFSAASIFLKKDSVFLTLPLKKWLTTSKRMRKKITSNKHRPYWNMVETSMLPTLGRLLYFRKQQRNWKSLPKKVWYLPKHHLKKHVSNGSFQ